LSSPLTTVVTGVGLALLALGPIASAEVGPRPEYRNVVAQARESAWKAIGSGQASGVTVAVMERGELVYSEGLGVADRAQNRAVDRHTRFNIGSVSKMFAAVALLWSSASRAGPSSISSPTASGHRWA
jgi:CubicO group peptidase (beta-lactamase class C family)